MDDLLVKTMTDVLERQAKAWETLSETLAKGQASTNANLPIHPSRMGQDPYANRKSAFNATSGSAVELHGDGSLFGNQSLERDVITAHVRPSGILTALPLFASVIEDPRYAILTGFSDDIGNEPANPCDPAPTGYMKACNGTARFGRLARDTEVIDIDRVMVQRNRGDFTDLQLQGRLLGLTDLVPGSINENQVLNVVTMAEMVNVGVRLERKLTKLAWQGDPANNNAGGGYKEAPGLDLQIGTGHVDADSGVACPAVDSWVEDFDYADVGGPLKDIVEFVSAMAYNLQFNALRMGLTPVSFALVMRPELWYELSAVWPCSYLSHKCGDSDGNSILTINDGNNVAMRDAMRNSLMIDINGIKYPVILDDGIVEETSTTAPDDLAPGEYASSIYMVPLRIMGNFPVLYREHMDYRRASADIALLRGKEKFWTDDGIYMWVVEQNRWCYQLGVKTEQRIILRTPHLAGRLDSVKYSPLAHTRSSDPTSASWFKDGGVSVRPDLGTNFYANWN